LKDHLQYTHHNVDAYHASNQAEVLGDDSDVCRGGLFMLYEQVEVALYLFDVFKRLLDIELLVQFGAPFQDVWFDLFPCHFAQSHIDGAIVVSERETIPPGDLVPPRCTSFRFLTTAEYVILWIILQGRNFEMM
jgi:hypothetical protein